MELENGKTNHIKTTIALTSTIALLGAGVGVSHQVQADDLSPTGAENSNNESPLLPTTATVADATAAVKTAETQLASQQNELIAVNKDIKNSSLEVSDLKTEIVAQEKAVEVAQETLTTVSTSNDAEFEKLVTENQVKLAETNKALSQAQTSAQTVSSDVQKQTQVVATQSEAAKTLVKEAESADKAVADLTKVVNQPEMIASQVKDAQNTVKIAASDLTKAQTNLATVKQETKTALTTSLASNKTALTAKQAELNAAQSQTSTKTVNIAGENTFVLPSNYPFAELKRLADSGYIGSWSYISAFNKLESAISSKARAGMTLNSYKNIAKDLNRQVDLDNLSLDVQNELALFTAQMLNSVRSQLNLSKIEVTEGSQQFARLVTTQYKATHGSTIPYFSYGQVGAGGHTGIGPHDRTIIESSATRVGLKANDDNMYENFGMFDDLPTVNGIKRSIYNTLKYMLFTDDLHGNTWGHAVNFLRTDKANASNPIYLGFSTESVGGLDTHFLLIPKSNIQNKTLFSTKAVSAGKTTINNSAKIQSLKSGISSIKGNITTIEKRLNNLSAEEAVKTAQAQVIKFNTKLSAAKQSLAKLEAQAIQAKKSKDGLQIQLALAKTIQADVKAKLDETLVSLNSAKRSLKTLETKLVQAAAQVTSLVDKKVNLAKMLELKQNPKRVELAKEALAQAKKDLAETNAKLIVSNKVLVDLFDTRTQLQDAIKLSEKQISLLKAIVNTKGDESKVQKPTKVQTPVVHGGESVSSIAAKPIEYNEKDSSVLTSADITKEKISDTSEKDQINSETERMSASTSLIAQKTEQEIAEIKAVITEKIATATSTVIAETNKVLTNEANKIAHGVVEVVPETMPAQSILNKVAKSVSENNNSESSNYGSTTVSKVTAASDESTKRAVKAGIVMLTAVGLTGFKLRKQGKK